MKKAVFVILSIISFSIGLSAQRKVRKETHAGDNKYSEQSYGAAEEKYKKAIEVYTQSVEKDKKHEIKDEDRNKEAFYNLGNTYYKESKWDDALKTYENYAKMETNEQKQSWAWSNSGNAYLHKAIEPKQEKGEQQQDEQQMQQQESLPRMEDLEKSIDAYKNALRRNPNDDDSRYNLAVAQKLLQDQKDNQDKNKDNKQDKNKQDKNNKDQNKQDQDKKDQDKDKKDQNKQDQEQDNNGMSQQNIEQMLNAMEQQEKETQAKVQQLKAQEEKRKNAQNKKQDKDW